MAVSSAVNAELEFHMRYHLG